MKIEAILAVKGTDVATIAPDAYVRDLISALAERRKAFEDFFQSLPKQTALSRSIYPAKDLPNSARNTAVDLIRCPRTYCRFAATKAGFPTLSSATLRGSRLHCVYGN